MSRTVIDFVPAVAPWPVVDVWASTNGFSLTAHGEWGRTYKRGNVMWTGVTFVQIEALPTCLRLSGWMPYWGVGPDLSLDHLDPIVYFPRKKSQKLVNKLLRELGVPVLT